MTATVETVLADALRLSAPDRQKLMEALCAAAMQADPGDAPPDWHLEIIEQRLRESSGDPSGLIPAEKVYEDLLLKLRGTAR